MPGPFRDTSSVIHILHCFMQMELLLKDMQAARGHAKRSRRLQIRNRSFASHGFPSFSWSFPCIWVPFRGTCFVTSKSLVNAQIDQHIRQADCTCRLRTKRKSLPAPPPSSLPPSLLVECTCCGISDAGSWVSMPSFRSWVSMPSSRPLSSKPKPSFLFTTRASLDGCRNLDYISSEFFLLPGESGDHCLEPDQCECVRQQPASSCVCGFSNGQCVCGWSTAAPPDCNCLPPFFHSRGLCLLACPLCLNKPF